MRPIEEILRTYNIVNSRAGSRYTVRFTAGILLSGAFVLAAVMILTGGPDGATVPDTYRATAEDGAGDPSAADGGDPFAITTEEDAGKVYIGYPTAAFDPGQKARYDRDAINVAVIEWLAAHPDSAMGHPEPVHDPSGETLLGYRIDKTDTPALP